MARKDIQLGFVYLFLAIFSWATMEVGLKWIQNIIEIPATTANFFRTLFGAFTLIIYILITRKTRSLVLFAKKYPKYYIPAAIIGLTLGLSLYFLGTLMTQASYAAAIFSSNPIFISLLAILFFHEKVSKKKIIGTLLGFIGVLLMITELNFRDFISQNNLVGNLIAFVGMILWCFDVVIGKLIMNKARDDGTSDGNESQNFNVITMIISGVTLLPFIIPTDGFSHVSEYNLEVWMGLIYLGAITGGFGYLFFFKGLDLTEASTGINVFYFKPAIATILSYFLLNEVPTLFLLVGVVIEIIALVLVTKD